MSARLGVVVPHYRQPEQLARTLAALELADVRGGIEVVVADDGSPNPPRPGRRPYPVRVVRQEDEGFRLAAVRNLGAGAVDAPVLCFLDADTVPEPGCLAALAAAVADGVTVAVGRRRHADLAGWSPGAVQDWLRGERPGPPKLEEPAWLHDGYRRTRDLRDADDSAFRLVIGALLAVPRRVWEVVGGFDESFVRYGGEDWELAHRAVVAGADLRHVPAAVGWHDGPDLAARGVGLARVKNAETAHLATRLPHPAVRVPGLVHAIPETVVRLDVTGWTLGQAVLTAAGLLHGSDAGIWVRGADEALLAAVREDPRVRVGAVPAGVLSRARFLADVDAPVVPAGGSLTALLRDGLPERPPPEGWAPPAGRSGLVARRSRWDGWADLRGCPRPGGWSPPAEALRGVPEDAVIEWWRP